MTVVILIAAPEGLRGHLTRWLVEVSAGVFVGKMNQRLRDRIWPILEARVGDAEESGLVGALLAPGRPAAPP